jgi:HSP20 family protein
MGSRIARHAKEEERTAMDWKKIAPWNWFKDEEATRPSRGTASGHPTLTDTLSRLRGELDRFFEMELGGSPFAPARPGGGLSPLKPAVDIAEGRKAYTVRVELPGVERNDVSVSADGQTLAIRAEKRQDREEDEEGVHWVESHYGAVQRILSLPDDADVAAIEARFRNGVLKLKVPKHAAPAATGRRVEIEAD